MRIAVLAAVSLVLAHTARADTLETDKSETTAFGLAVGGTLVGPALVALAINQGDSAGSPLHAEFWPMMATGGVAMVLGPSLGNWYAGKVGSTGLNLRLGGAAVVAVGAAMAIDGFHILDTPGNDTELLAGGLIGLAGLGMVATGTVLDLISAPHAAAEHDRHHLAFAPLVGAKQTGFAIAGTF